ncbi:unnamed protein product [Amoebophrya sp. A120]|nr:unnamed protein product [Amoebophrya sp. A120]|eukprot:GSA120T00013333001.1
MVADDSVFSPQHATPHSPAPMSSAGHHAAQDVDQDTTTTAVRAAHVETQEFLGVSGVVSGPNNSGGRGSGYEPERRVNTITDEDVPDPPHENDLQEARIEGEEFEHDEERGQHDENDHSDSLLGEEEPQIDDVVLEDEENALLGGQDRLEQQVDHAVSDRATQLSTEIMRIRSRTLALIDDLSSELAAVERTESKIETMLQQVEEACGTLTGLEKKPRVDAQAADHVLALADHEEEKGIGGATEAGPSGPLLLLHGASEVPEAPEVPATASSSSSSTNSQLLVSDAEEVLANPQDEQEQALTSLVVRAPDEVVTATFTRRGSISSDQSDELDASTESSAPAEQIIRVMNSVELEEKIKTLGTRVAKRREDLLQMRVEIAKAKGFIQQREEEARAVLRELDQTQWHLNRLQNGSADDSFVPFPETSEVYKKMVETLKTVRFEGRRKVMADRGEEAEFLATEAGKENHQELPEHRVATTNAAEQASIERATPRPSFLLVPKNQNVLLDGNVSVDRAARKGEAGRADSLESEARDVSRNQNEDDRTGDGKTGLIAGPVLVPHRISILTSSTTSVPGPPDGYAYPVKRRKIEALSVTSATPEDFRAPVVGRTAGCKNSAPVLRPPLRTGGSSSSSSFSRNCTCSGSGPANGTTATSLAVSVNSRAGFEMETLASTRAAGEPRLPLSASASPGSLTVLSPPVFCGKVEDRSHVGSTRPSPDLEMRSPSRLHEESAPHQSATGVLPREDARRNAQVVHGEQETENNDEADPNFNTFCAVCQCDFEYGDELKVLPCGHTFHTACILKALQYSTKCPLCQKKVLP